jgi:hypothetical protein
MFISRQEWIKTTLTAQFVLLCRAALWTWRWLSYSNTGTTCAPTTQHWFSLTPTRIMISIAFSPFR